MPSAKSPMKKPSFYETFSKSYKVLLFEKILPCRNFRQYNSIPLNIFRALYRIAFSVLLIISAGFYEKRDGIFPNVKSIF